MNLVLGWVLLGIAGVLALALYGIFRWASTDPAIDDHIEREKFRAEQDCRGARRSGEAPDAAEGRERLQNVR